MGILLPPITTDPVELVAVDDPALDWSATERPKSAVCEYRVAPLKGSQIPDVFLCRPLTAMELLGIRNSIIDQQTHVSLVSICYNGLMQIRPAEGDAIADRREIWQAIETHRIPQDVFLGLARWIWEASWGDTAGRRFRAGSAPNGGGA
jgi:hypothetical protein